MAEPVTNRWSGKSAEEVLSESFHEIRNPIILLAGYLGVLKSGEMTDEQTRHILEVALRCSQSAKDIVESVYQYMTEQRGNP